MPTRHDFDGWCILELLGHRRVAGYLRSQEIAGHKFIRVDIPGETEECGTTQYYAPGTVYCITPTTEAIARAVAQRQQPAPVREWELPRHAPQPVIDRPLRDAALPSFSPEIDDDEDDQEHAWDLRG